MKEFQKTADSSPVAKNGREAPRAEAVRAKLYQTIDRAEADIVAGRVTDAREVSAGLRAKYGL